MWNWNQKTWKLKGNVEAITIFNKSLVLFSSKLLVADIWCLGESFCNYEKVIIETLLKLKPVTNWCIYVAQIISLDILIDNNVF